MKYTILLLCTLMLLAACSGATGRAIQSDEIEIKGSDTLLQLVSNLAEAYGEEHPDGRISVTGGGSGAGIAALINGEIHVADASRPIKEAEIAMAEERGIEVSEFIIARDMLSVITHADNPITELTRDEVSSIYQGTIKNWQEVGGEDAPITLYGRQSTSGTYVFFMEEVVQGEYAATMRNMEGNQAILDAVRRDQTGIGYVGIGYIIDEEGATVSGINVLPIGAEGEAVSPLDASRLAEYPISRALYQYTAGKPAPGSTLERFLQFAVSDEGQAIVERSGFVRITPADEARNAERLA